MQEVLVYTNRRTRARLTALGGFLAGCVIAGALAGGWQWRQGQQELTKLQGEFEAERKTLMDQRDVATRNAKVTEARYAGEPVAWFAGKAVRNVAELDRRLNRFPEFKTDTYRVPFEELKAEVAKQGDEVAALAKAIYAVEPPSRCAVSKQTDGAAVLWSEGSVALTSRGWTGVSP